MKFKTVYDGERALIIDRHGKKNVLDGPKRVNQIFRFIKDLTSFTQCL